METIILPYVLSLALVPLSLYLISFIRKINIFGDTKKQYPPGSMGWPLFGETIELVLSGPKKIFKKRMEKYSADVFKTSLFGQKIAVFCGAQGHKFLFTNEDKLVTFWVPQSFKAALGFPEFMEMSVKEASIVTNTFRHDIFKHDALKEYIVVMDALARDHFDTYWYSTSTPAADHKVVKVFTMTKKYVFEVAVRLLLNVVDPEQVNKLFESFSLIIDGLLSVPINFPGTAYNRALNGSKKIRQEFMRIIKERRKEIIRMQENKEMMISSTDVLSKMLLQGRGQVFSDLHICFSIMSLLFASYESTSSAATLVMNHLAELPNIYQEVYKEQMEIAKSKGPNELLTWQDVQNMKYSWNVIRETLRLTPPGIGAFREAITDFTYAGFTIPKGWKIFCTVYSTQMSSENFPEPEKFEPSRFEGNGPAPYTFVPFGGGPRMCAGREYARILILVFMHNVVTRFKFEKTISNEKFVMGTVVKPDYGLPLHVHPHHN